jgi:hypothetical protein
MTDKKRQIRQTGAALAGLFSVPCPSLGIDIDGCVDECPIFFRILTRTWPGKVFVVTYRNDEAKARADLEERGIRFDALFLVDSLEGKAEVIEREGILVFFDDQPECLKQVDSMRSVMLVRNGGNFDFADQKWMFSDQTGKLV